MPPDSPTDRPGLLRVMADAAWELEHGETIDDVWRGTLAYSRRLSYMGAALRAIEAAGCVVAPMEAQWHAGEKPVTTRSIYTATLAAGPFGEG